MKGGKQVRLAVLQERCNEEEALLDEAIRAVVAGTAVALEDAYSCVRV